MALCRNGHQLAGQLIGESTTYRLTKSRRTGLIFFAIPEIGSKFQPRTEEAPSVGAEKKKGRLSRCHKVPPTTLAANTCESAIRNNRRLVRTHPLESMRQLTWFLLAPKSEFMTWSDVPEGDPWATILLARWPRKCKNGRRAATGAKFRGRVREKVARSSRSQYPPEPGLKFGQFLAKRAKICTFQKRPGADLLVAPADKPDLLVEAANPGRIRQTYSTPT